MAIKTSVFSPKGMSRDTTRSKFSPDYLYDAYNIRITARGNDKTLLSISNERGNQKCEILEERTDTLVADLQIKGTLLGYCVINNWLTLFTKSDKDRIYRLQLQDEGNFKGKLLYEGDLNFSLDNPIETLGVYELEGVVKVYWIDGLNQPRMINILGDYSAKTVPPSNLVQDITGDGLITVTKDTTGGGTFTPGTIQYACSYYNKYGQESNLFYISPIQYIAYSSRGAKADSAVNCSFVITMSSLSTEYDFVRLYSIHRTSLDGTPEVRRLADISTSVTDFTDGVFTKTGSIAIGSNFPVSSKEAMYILYSNGTKSPISAFTHTTDHYRVGTDDITAYVYTVNCPAGSYIYAPDGEAAYFAAECTATVGVEIIDATSTIRTQDIKASAIFDYGNFAEGSGKVTFVDTGALGKLESDTYLKYVGGSVVIPKAMTHKDNTLFLGNLRLGKPALNKTIFTDEGYSNLKALMDNIRDDLTSAYLKVTFKQKSESYITDIQDFSLNQNCSHVLTFKGGETYRFGLIFQYRTGQWSEVYWLGDMTNPVYPVASDTNVLLSMAQVKIPESVSLKIAQAGFIKVRPVCVFPDLNNRTVVAQGVINPTVFDIKTRMDNAPFARSSWFFRPNPAVEQSSGGETAKSNVGYNPEFRANTFIPGAMNADSSVFYRNAEFNFNRDTSIRFVPSASQDEEGSSFWVDTSVCTLNSPEIEFDDSVRQMDMAGLKLRIVGFVPIWNTASDASLETSTPAYNADLGRFMSRYSEGFGQYGYDQLMAAPLYDDSPVIDRELELDNDKKVATLSWMVYPWNKSGSINNFGSIDKTVTAKPCLLKYHKMSLLRQSKWTEYLNESNGTGLSAWESDAGINDIKVFDLDTLGLVKLKQPENTNMGDLSYYGNVSEVLLSTDKYKRVVSSADGTLSLQDTSTVKLEGDKTSRDPISMKYKSSPHAVFGFNYSYTDVSGVLTLTQNVLPTFSNGTLPVNKTAYSTTDGSFFWNYKNITSGSMFDTVKQVQLLSTTDPDTYDVSGSTGDLGIFYLSGKYTLRVCKRTVTPMGGSAVIGTIKGHSYDGDDPENVSNVNVSHSWTRMTPSSTTRYVVEITEAGTESTESYVRDGDTYYLKEYAESTGTYDNQHCITDQKVISHARLTANASGDKMGFLWLGEIYRSSVPERFGGTTEQAFAKNIWKPCGGAVAVGGEMTVNFDEGDTYYQRYDSLKTYPFTLEDENSIVDILSFMVESHINLDGRYDRNRGQTNNLVMTPANFNLLNDVYSQSDDYFTYAGLEYSYFSQDYFPSQLTITEEKQAGSKVDKWTNVTLAATQDMDGDKGEITSLNRFNNEVFCFQRTGFSGILFNNRVQIPTSDSTPIQITNGLKLQGKQYVSDKVGCLNKWSIVESPDGLYFIDNITNSLYCYNGKLNSLSDSLGMRTWVNEVNSLSPWSPVYLGMTNFRGFYDKNNNDVYWSDKDYCIAYSELLGQFTSFHSYEGIPMMVNINDDFYSFFPGTDFSYSANSLWKQWAGDYNWFYGQGKPYWVTYLDNSAPQYDKIFNNLNFRLEGYSTSSSGKNEALSEYLSDKCFDRLDVHDEYQDGSMVLEQERDSKISLSPTLRKRFKIWRTVFPRAANGKDRIRNPWCYIKLSYGLNSSDHYPEGIDKYRVEMHELMANYFI